MRTSFSKLSGIDWALLVGLLASTLLDQTCAQSPGAQFKQTEAKPAASPPLNSPEKEGSTPETTQPQTSVPETPEEVRHAQLAADTRRLHQLAIELRAEIAKNNKDTLPLTAVSKAKELEKLANNLKARMAAEAYSRKQ